MLFSYAFICSSHKAIVYTDDPMCKNKRQFTMQTLLDFQNLMQNTGEKQFPDALIHMKIYIIWPQMNGHLIGNYTANT